MRDTFTKPTPPRYPAEAFLCVSTFEDQTNRRRPRAAGATGKEEAAARLIQVAGPYSLQQQLSVEALRIRQARVMTPVRVERLWYFAGDPTRRVLPLKRVRLR